MKILEERNEMKLNEERDCIEKYIYKNGITFAHLLMTIRN